jgi:hypothetical protein
MLRTNHEEKLTYFSTLVVLTMGSTLVYRVEAVPYCPGGTGAVRHTDGGGQGLL